MTILFWFVVAVVTLVAGSFAVSNNVAVTIGLWPLPGTVQAPLYLIVFALLVVGFACGRASAWLAHGRLRSAHRARGREIAQLQRRATAPPYAAPTATSRSLTTT